VERGKTKGTESASKEKELRSKMLSSQIRGRLRQNPEGPGRALGVTERPLSMPGGKEEGPMAVDVGAALKAAWGLKKTEKKGSPLCDGFDIS